MKFHSGPAPASADLDQPMTLGSNRPRLKLITARCVCLVALGGMLLALAGTGVLLVARAQPVRAGVRSSLSGGGRSSHRLVATIQEVDILTGPVPSAGSTATAAATVQSTVGGNGAQVTHLMFTGTTGAPATFGFHATATAFFAHGSFSLALQGTLAVGSGGSLKFAGTGKITGGTERYRRARGTVTFAGTAPNPGPGHVDTFRLEGTLTY
jgi:hypothetical protein